MDTILLPLLDDLRGCLAGRLTETLGGWTEGCPIAVVPGQDVIADWCSCGGKDACGMGWVRLADAFPTREAFPTPDRLAATGTAVVSAVVEVGVFRCLPVASRSGRATAAPTPADQTQAALVAADDAMATYRAILCCDAIMGRPHLIGRYTPRSSGDCGGGFWTVTVQLNRRVKPAPR